MLSGRYQAAAEKVISSAPISLRIEGTQAVGVGRVKSLKLSRPRNRRLFHAEIFLSKKEVMEHN